MHSFDAITAEEMVRQGSAKWTAFPGTIGMWLAEMDFGIADELDDFLTSQAHVGSLGYLPEHEGKQIIESCASYIDELCGWRPEAKRMHLVPDVLSALRMTIELFTPAGSPIVVPTPAYMPFLTIPGEFDREVIEVPSILGEDGLWRFDYDGIEEAFERGAGLFVLCNPWNPAGRCLPHEELERLDGLVEQYDVRVFEDGIHFPLIFEGSEAVPFGAVSENAAAHTVTAVAASKGWNIPGLKCAQLIFHNDDDAARFAPLTARFTGATSTLGARAARVCFEDGREWNEDMRRYLMGNRDIVAERVASWDGVRMGKVEGTYIAFLDFSDLAERGVFGGMSPAEWIRENAGVSLTSGKLSGSDFENWTRMTFANPRPVLIEALDRIEHALFS
ncbi:MAG: aminotransferase class I/II-fold pyridoxal phosphate-dependent enzyme [Actinomycetaceae bacterium]|nr:aminotransferase class I/II-fold pyridoxal phosphate-dependent enzyme [Actinomycetaceae bacterium]